MSNTTVLESVVPAVIKDAADRGTDFAHACDVVFRALTEAYPGDPAQIAVAGYAGRRELLRRSGGCVDARQAAVAYAGAHSVKPAQPETVRRAARERRLISIRDGHGEILFPVWQFDPDAGGALPDIPVILKELSLRPGFSEITPFVFFLQGHPRLGTTPLKALLSGRSHEVIEAAKQYRF